MALVGDVLTEFRNLARDPAGTLAQPATPALVGTSGGTLSGTVFLIVTWLTPWGETVPSPEQTLALGGNTAVTDSGTLLPPPPGATAGRIYIGTTAGGENQFYPVNIGGTTTILNLTAGTGAVVPKRNRAWLPDTDGLINTQQAYRWLNGALVKLGVITGGILDQSGAAPGAGANEFVIPGWWFYMTDLWHDGWVVLPERAVFTWMKSPLSGVPGIASVWQNASRQIMNLWPQPGVGLTTTTTSASVGIADATISVVNSANFRAPGLALIDNEVIAYASIGGQVNPQQPLATGSQVVPQGATSAVVIFGQLPIGGTVIPQAGTSWTTTISFSGVTSTQFTANFGTAAPLGGGSLLWTVQVAPGAGQFNILGSCVRAFGGTAAATHSNGATATYLIFRFRGMRIPSTYVLGSSAISMDLPPAWDEPLPVYMLAKKKEYEQDMDGAGKKMQEFEAMCKELEGMQTDPTGPRQIGYVAPFIGDSQNLEDLVGTILIP